MTGPNFFIIGAAKAATTSLSSLLESHPEAAIVQHKEPHFFSYDKRFQMGWSWYLGLYSHCVGQTAIGDSSTSYSRIRYYPNTIERIKHHVPDAKIIYMVRQPLQRMESAYVEHMCTPGGRVFSSINDAIRKEPMIMDSSRYWEVFDAYRQKFDESRIKIIWFEEYVVDTLSVFQDVCRFLEIDPMKLPDLQRERTNSRQNASLRLVELGRRYVEINTTWDNKIRQEVINEIQEDNQRFLAYFGKDKEYWNDLF